MLLDPALSAWHMTELFGVLEQQGIKVVGHGNSGNGNGDRGTRGLYNRDNVGVWGKG